MKQIQQPVVAYYCRNNVFASAFIHLHSLHKCISLWQLGNPCKKRIHRRRISTNLYKVLINATVLCCVLQPETPYDLDKYYKGHVEIGCIEAPESSCDDLTSTKAWDKETVNMNINPSAMQKWEITIAITCTATIILFAVCIGTILIIETI